MAGCSLAQLGLLSRAARPDVRTAGVETAAGRGIERTRHVALQHNALGAQAGIWLLELESAAFARRTPNSDMSHSGCLPPIYQYC